MEHLTQEQKDEVYALIKQEVINAVTKLFENEKDAKELFESEIDHLKTKYAILMEKYTSLAKHVGYEDTRNSAEFINDAVNNNL